MSKKIKSYDIYGLVRFLATLILLAFLAFIDIHEEESIPNVIYLIIGGLNGVDAYKLYNEVKKGYDDSSNE